MITYSENHILSMSENIFVQEGIRRSFCSGQDIFPTLTRTIKKIHANKLHVNHMSVSLFKHMPQIFNKTHA